MEDDRIFIIDAPLTEADRRALMTAVNGTVLCVPGYKFTMYTIPIWHDDAPGRIGREGAD